MGTFNLSGINYLVISSLRSNRARL